MELWHRIHVADRPNAELILKGLSDLPKGESLPSELVKRVRANLARLGAVAWEDGGHWLNLASEWVPTSQLKYSAVGKVLGKEQELFPAIRKAVADFQMLDSEALNTYPFADLPSLASCLEEQVSSRTLSSFQKSSKPWLACLARNLIRIELTSEGDQTRVQEAAARLARTAWRQGTSLETVPYLEGVPAGPERRVPVLWLDDSIYVADSSVGRLAPAVAREIVRCFKLPASANALSSSLVEAIVFCFDREVRVIEEYLEQEFKLGPVQQVTLDTEIVSVDAPLVVSNPVASELPSSQTGLAVETPGVQGGREEAVERQEQTAPLVSPGLPHREPHRQERPSLVERFAAALGLRSDGNGGYLGVDGSALLRTRDSAFPWELRRGGELVQYLLPEDHCLDLEPLVIKSENWSLLRGMPETHALIVLSPEGTPVTLTGGEIFSQLDQGRITLYPASYRLARTL